MAKAMGAKAKPMTNVKDLPQRYICPHCGKEKPKSAFYISSDPAISIGIAFPCKDCAERIARNYNENYKQFGDCTERSIQAALEYLDKPFLRSLYESSVNEVHDETLKKPKTNVWAAYIKNVQMTNYATMRWRDGDLLQDNILDNSFDIQENALDESSEQYLTYRKNKA